MCVCVCVCVRVCVCVWMCSPKLGRHQKEPSKRRVCVCVCVCVLGVSGGTSTLNAKETKGIDSYLMILTFFVNLGSKVISDIREVQICSIGNQQFLWECRQRSKTATSLTQSTEVQAKIK